MTNSKPILFQAPMVRAILEGRKTQTRRALKPQPPANTTSAGTTWSSETGPSNTWTWLSGDPKDCDTWETLGDFKVRWKPDDMLWVREKALFWIRTADNKIDKVAAYAADGYELETGERWTPSIHMPRWASRITLRVASVKVERLQDISEVDAMAEGIQRFGRFYAVEAESDWDDARTSAKKAFADLFKSINGEPIWAANPWVAAISFEHVKELK